jgi:hypothetical protein
MPRWISGDGYRRALERSRLIESYKNFFPFLIVTLLLAAFRRFGIRLS